MTNDEINRRVAAIMEPMPSEPPAVFDVNNETPGGAWWYDVMDETGWQPLDFCTDIAAAWRCVEWTESKDILCDIIRCPHYTGSGREFTWKYSAYFKSILYIKSADTAPLAIALAFIAAFGGE